MTAAKPIPAGRRFSRLVVIERADNAGNSARYTCQCDCGRAVAVRAGDLRSGRTQSCGCLGRQSRSRRFLRHGAKAGDREATPRSYTIWINVRQRCRNPSGPSWPKYGGRGIKLCERWLEYEKFVADMGEPPPGHSIERLDVNGDYTPGNCVWATPKAQARNKRNTIRIAVGDVSLPLAEACEKYSIRYGGVTDLVYRNGLTYTEAFEIRLGQRNPQGSSR